MWALWMVSLEGSLELGDDGGVVLISIGLAIRPHTLAIVATANTSMRLVADDASMRSICTPGKASMILFLSFSAEPPSPLSPQNSTSIFFDIIYHNHHHIQYVNTIIAIIILLTSNHPERDSLGFMCIDDSLGFMCKDDSLRCIRCISSRELTFRRLA